MLNLGKIPRKISRNPLDRELGFGKVLAPNSRLMNSDGSFTGQREAINFWDNTYHYLVTISWRHFFFLALAFFIFVNVCFGTLYFFMGVENFNGITPGSPLHNFVQAFFSLSWTIVHPLDDDSPIIDFSEQDLIDANAEFMVLVKGTDEIFQQVVHARHSYSAEEIVWNAKFSPILQYNETGVPKVMTSRVGRFEKVVR